MIKDLFKSVLLVMVKLLTVGLNAKYPNPKVIALIKDQTEKKVFVSSGLVFPLRSLEYMHFLYFPLFEFLLHLKKPQTCKMTFQK